MTRIYVISLLILLAVASCRENSEVDLLSSPNDNVSFAVTLEPQTKGTLVTSEELMSSMGIYCAYTKDDVWSTKTIFDKMENMRLDYDSALSEWVYDQDEDTPAWGYESTIDRYTFMGYSPYEDGKNIMSKIENGDLIIEYSVPEDCASQPDLMIALPRKDIYPQISGEVALNFKHALAAIGFNVIGVATEIITDITISGVVASGELSISDSGDIAWSLGPRTQVSYSAKIDSDVTPNVYTPAGLTLDNGYLMMIPQEIDQVTLDVTVYNTESKESTIKSFPLATAGEWESGCVYSYTIILSSYDYTIEGTSNSYILHPNGEEQLFYIPVEGRINTFWRDYADDNSTYENILSSSDEWEAELLWSDFNGNTNGFKVERVTSGFSPNESVTPFCEPDFTTPGTRSAMKITLPSNIDEGNFLVAVSFNGKILWSWHLWVTDYNPDLIAADNEAQQGKYIYTSDGVEGEVHRYDAQDLWSTLYDNRFIMDRNLGARDCDYSTNRAGVLHYQFGRKDPFSAESSLSPNIENDCVSFATSVENPTSFYVRKSKAYSWSQEGLAMDSDYLWFDKSVANDPNASGKSIFDPSPLGWRVPRYGTFTVLDNNNCNYVSGDNMLLYNGVIKFPMTGYRSNNSGDVNDYGNQGNIRLSTQIDSSFGCNFVYNPYVDPDTNNTLADGFCVRCIEE